MLYGHAFLYHRYRSMQANEVMHEAKWTSVGNDGMVTRASIFISLSEITLRPRVVSTT